MTPNCHQREIIVSYENLEVLQASMGSMARQAVIASRFLADPSHRTTAAAKYPCGAVWLSPHLSEQKGILQRCTSIDDEHSPRFSIESGICSAVQSKANYVCSFDHLNQGRAILAI